MLYLTHPCASERLVIETLPGAFGAHNIVIELSRETNTFSVQ